MNPINENPVLNPGLIEKALAGPPRVDEEVAKPKHTPGPWMWYGDAEGQIRLCTPHSGMLYILDCVRAGMNGAQLRFRQPERCRMTPARDLCVFEVGNRGVVGLAAAKLDDSVYRYTVTGIDHPDAMLIAAAPDLLTELKELVAGLETVTTPTPWLQERLASTRAAIARAEGTVRPC